MKLNSRWLALLFLAGCALYSDVVVGPLRYKPSDIDRGGDLESMLRKSDFNRAVSLATEIDSEQRKSAQQLATLGEAELIAGRFDAARRHLREAIELQPPQAVYAAVTWDLSQLEFMSNNFAASLDWARLASNHGINIRSWLMSYLDALAKVSVYQFSGAASERLPMRFGRPDVPRIDVTINGIRSVSAIIDSGAMLSIISQTLANALPVNTLGSFEGTFFGLLGEPIPVRFGILKRLDLGTMSIAQVPVAIMPDKEMKFFVKGNNEFKSDFLLGANLLKEFRIELDFRRNSVAFTQVPSGARHPVADQNLFIEQFRPTVRSTINGHGWFMVVLDTGSEVTFLNERQLGALPMQIFVPKLHNATLQGLGGAQKRGEKLENVEIGVDRWAGTFRTIPMYDAGEHEHTAGILGENYLKNFSVRIDFGTMRVDLDPVHDPPAATDTAQSAHSGVEVIR